jgi:RNA polymerase sigma-70 factor (ECF subfamily)
LSDPLQDASGETAMLLARLRAGDRSALDDLLARHRELLRSFVEYRLDAKLSARLDASDVIQEAQLEVAQRIDDYLRRDPMPFHLWLRQTAYQNLNRLRRQHLGAECRAAEREVPLPDRSSILLAQMIMAGSALRPGRQMLQDELAHRVAEALARLDALDREILMMRFFDDLNNQEVATVLDLEPGTASKRFGRALLRLRKILEAEGPEEPPS